MPAYIKAKNVEIAQKALEHFKAVVPTIPKGDITKIGMELFVGRTETLDKYVVQIGGLTITDAIKIYMPEILALTVGSFLLGCVAGYQIKEKNLLKKL